MGAPRGIRATRGPAGGRVDAATARVRSLAALTTPAFRILGPLEVELDERVVALGRRERALLGVLLLNAGAVVSVERLIDGVWGEAPPSSAKHMVHEYVSRLRQALGDASRIATRVPGYLAVCSDDELDARRFSALAAAARTAASAGEHAEALQAYDEALDSGGAMPWRASSSKATRVSTPRVSTTTACSSPRSASTARSRWAGTGS